MNSGIYIIRNTRTSEIYVGSSRDIVKRKRGHYSGLHRGEHDNHRLQKSFNKYGESCFEFVVIEQVEVDKLIEREQHWIDTLKPQFNIALKADNHPINATKAVREARRKTADSQRGKPKSQRGRDNIARGRREYWLNPQNRERHIQIIRESANKIREGVSKFIFTFISPDGEEVETRSVRQLAKERRLSENWMREVANGKRKSNSGWTLKEKVFVGFRKDRHEPA